MKVAISIDDDTFAAAERAAERLGLSRSAIYSRALETYLRELDEEALEAELNRAYAAAPGEGDDFAREAARRTFDRLAEGEAPRRTRRGGRA